MANGSRDPYQRLGRALIIDTLEQSLSEEHRDQVEAELFVETELCQLICHAIGIESNDLLEMLGSDQARRVLKNKQKFLGRINPL